jgi:GMC oxidoreductase
MDAIEGRRAQSLTFQLKGQTKMKLSHSKHSDDAFDYVIVGPGAAGSVLANRLSEDPNNRVLLSEYGGRDWNPIIYVPKGSFSLSGVSATPTNTPPSP